MRRLAVLIGVLLCGPITSISASSSGTRAVVFWQKGFPFADTTPVSRRALAAALRGFHPEFVGERALGRVLSKPAAERTILIWPYGSAFPPSSWIDIVRFVSHGGNLLVLGGRPFSVAVEKSGTRLTFAFSRELYILNSFPLSSARAAKVGRQETNSDFSFLNIPTLPWSRLFEMTPRLSERNAYPRLGSWGTWDAVWRPLARLYSPEGVPLAAPISVIDHRQGRFAGSRWVFTLFEPKTGFWDGKAGQDLIHELAAFSDQGSVLLTLRPTLANYRQGETPALRLEISAPSHKFLAQVDVRSLDSGRPGPILFSTQAWVAGNLDATIGSPRFPVSSGLHEFLAVLKDSSSVLDVYPTGYWREDLSALSGGAPFTAGRVYLRRGGRAYPVLGTTYMESDAHRYFLLDPNPYFFDQDMAQLQKVGFNMLRTGVWTGWDKLANPDGTATVQTLRAAEAFLLSAKRHHLPAQFNFFAFMPEVFGGANAYLDPAAVAREKNWVLSFARHFRGDPGLMWDLINEPSFDNRGEFFNGNVPNGDVLERKAWTRWLLKRYKTRGRVAEAWNLPAADLGSGPFLPLPGQSEMSLPWSRIYPDASSDPLKAYDFNLFAQDVFARWAGDMRGAIRALGGKQLVTAGQDAGGNMNRLLNPFFAKSVDFTDNHIWGDADATLWNVLIAKAPDRPDLVQETGVKPVDAPDSFPRMDEDETAALLERRMSAALGAGAAGAIEWVWNVNDLMADDGEVGIGAVRGDGTEKPEADVLRGLAAFGRAAFPYFTEPKRAPVALILPQSLQLSVEEPLAIRATQSAVRALAYRLRVPLFAEPEMDLGNLVQDPPKLAILPSAQILSDAGWRAILKLVRLGTTVLITGPVERDEHFRPQARLAALEPGWRVQTLISREAYWGGASPLSFGQDRDGLDLEQLAGPQGLSEIALGRGRILVCAYPAELNDNLAALSEVYAGALAKAGVAPQFKTDLTDAGVLIRRTEFRKAVLYLFLSESSADRNFWIRDPDAGKFQVALPAGRSELALYERGSGRLIARYQPPAF